MLLSSLSVSRRARGQAVVASCSWGGVANVRTAGAGKTAAGSVSACRCRVRAACVAAASSRSASRSWGLKASTGAAIATADVDGGVAAVVVKPPSAGVSEGWVVRGRTAEGEASTGIGPSSGAASFGGNGGVSVVVAAGMSPALTTAEGDGAAVVAATQVCHTGAVRADDSDGTVAEADAASIARDAAFGVMGDACAFGVVVAAPTGSAGMVGVVCKDAGAAVVAASQAGPARWAAAVTAAGIDRTLATAAVEGCDAAAAVGGRTPATAEVDSGDEPAVLDGGDGAVVGGGAAALFGRGGAVPTDDRDVELREVFAFQIGSVGTSGAVGRDAKAGVAAATGIGPALTTATVSAVGIGCTPAATRAYRGGEAAAVDGRDGAVASVADAALVRNDGTVGAVATNTGAGVAAAAGIGTARTASEDDRDRAAAAVPAAGIGGTPAAAAVESGGAAGAVDGRTSPTAAVDSGGEAAVVGGRDGAVVEVAAATLVVRVGAFGRGGVVTEVAAVGKDLDGTSAADDTRRRAAVVVDARIGPSGPAAVIGKSGGAVVIVGAAVNAAAGNTAAELDRFAAAAAIGRWGGAVGVVAAEVVGRGDAAAICAGGGRHRGGRRRGCCHWRGGRRRGRRGGRGCRAMWAGGRLRGHDILRGHTHHLRHCWLFGASRYSGIAVPCRQLRGETHGVTVVGLHLR